ncbi:hypothetical protein SeMB42_g01626 [Synchytrium endobioticum]|uniref:Uncharacterized protein n=1 Tax=Synchytrium endobioticum TaxID=286115 RepID=A0A507CHV1_9FUNG|nr:hypothetical protein SeLEV6574_g07441 [Synchytrium endobioticum]TPX52154.1 hypothetical protein SeMB42_g01626 [Synchytrium endobioticum]
MSTSRRKRDRSLATTAAVLPSGGHDESSTTCFASIWDFPFDYHSKSTHRQASNSGSRHFNIRTNRSTKRSNPPSTPPPVQQALSTSSTTPTPTPPPPSPTASSPLSSVSCFSDSSDDMNNDPISSGGSLATQDKDIQKRRNSSGNSHDYNDQGNPRKRLLFERQNPAKCVHDSNHTITKQTSTKSSALKTSQKHKGVKTVRFTKSTLLRSLSAGNVPLTTSDSLITHPDPLSQDEGAHDSAAGSSNNENVDAKSEVAQGWDIAHSPRILGVGAPFPGKRTLATNPKAMDFDAFFDTWL